MICHKTQTNNQTREVELFQLFRACVGGSSFFTYLSVLKRKICNVFYLFFFFLFFLLAGDHLWRGKPFLGGWFFLLSITQSTEKNAINSRNNNKIKIELIECLAFFLGERVHFKSFNFFEQALVSSSFIWYSIFPTQFADFFLLSITQSTEKNAINSRNNNKIKIELIECLAFFLGERVHFKSFNFFERALVSSSFI